jgi:outer membrane protein assembly factor BamB
VTADTGYAAPTPVTDGQRVYVIFANMDVAAVDYSGKLVWARNLGRVENSYGHATSLRLFEGRLLVQVDHNDVDSAQSKLYALDVRTGREVWSVSRPVEAAWTTPLLIGLGDESQLVTVAAPWMISYRPRTGEEIWRAQCVSGETAPSPIGAGGFVLAISPHDSVVAMKTDGRGDVTKTHEAWKSEDGVPDICSPVCDGNWLYVLTTQGELRCLAAATGKEMWMHNYEKDFYASPLVSNGRLLLVSAEGELHLLESGQVHKEVGTRALGEKVSASPLPHRAGLIVRGETNLFCIEAGKAE